MQNYTNMFFIKLFPDSPAVPPLRLKSIKSHIISITENNTRFVCETTAMPAIIEHAEAESVEASNQARMNAWSAQSSKVIQDRTRVNPWVSWITIINHIVMNSGIEKAGLFDVISD